MALSNQLWRENAGNIVAAVSAGTVSCAEVTRSILDHAELVNSSVNALVETLPDQAMATAEELDKKIAAGGPVGPLHGVPITIKVNTDVAGRPTTDGVSSRANATAEADSPVVRSLRDAGAVIFGRTNTPAFSVRWFTDNDIHGRTLNPFDQRVTPGGSSGGAAVAVATGMGPIAHGSDYGGSVRFPAWACGVVGLRPTAGRIPAYKSTAPARTVTNQMMSVQGPLARSVSDIELALEVMAAGSPLDPGWVPAPLKFDDSGAPLRVAVFSHHPSYDVEPSVARALEQAGRWLAGAGHIVEPAEPPRFEEACEIWSHLVFNDMRRGMLPAINAEGDSGTRSAMKNYLEGLPDLDRDQYLEGLTRRWEISREWAVFLQEYPVILMPVCWQRQFPIDSDQHSASRMAQLVAAQSPLLATALMGLPGLSVPTGVVDGLPVGVQIVSWRFREDLVLRAAKYIEAAANFSALEYLVKRPADGTRPTLERSVGA